MDFDFSTYYNKNFQSSSSFRTGFLILLIDVLVLFLCIGFGFFVVNLFSPSSINFKSFVNYILFIPIIILVYAFNGLYPGIMIPPTEQLKKISTFTFFSFFTIVLGLFVADLSNDFFSQKYIIKGSKDIAICMAFFIAYPFVVIFLPGSREIAKRIFQKKKWYGVPAIIYSSDNSSAFVLNKLLKNRYLGYHPCLIIDSEAKGISFENNIPKCPPNNEIYNFINKFNIKVAIICDYKGDITKIMSNYRYTINIAKTQNSFTSTQHIKDIAGIIGFSSTHNLTFKGNLLLKRILDISLILIFAPIWLPIFIIIAILVKLTSKGPIFYGHSRIGKNGKVIKCWKFRSMNINSQEMLEEILRTDEVRRKEWEKERKFTDDPRVTKFGKVIRKTSLDELPQIINILLGQMSFVGPRPVTEPELEKYGDYKDYVLSVTPGLSGMWQTSGRSDTSYEERITLDTYYIQNWSIWLDIWILIKTVWVVIKGKGAY